MTIDSVAAVREGIMARYRMTVRLAARWKCLNCASRDTKPFRASPEEMETKRRDHAGVADTIDPRRGRGRGVTSMVRYCYKCKQTYRWRW